MRVNYKVWTGFPGREGRTAPKGSLIYLHEAALSLSQLWSQCAMRPLGV